MEIIGLAFKTILHMEILTHTKLVTCSMASPSVLHTWPHYATKITVEYNCFLVNLESHREIRGDCGGTVVKVLCYKSEGRWFDSRLCHWNFPVT